MSTTVSTYALTAGRANQAATELQPEPVSGTLDGLERLPAEILLDIYQHLDVESVHLLAQTNTLFQGLFKRNKSQILLPVLRAEFSPFEELVQVFTASDADLLEPAGTYQPRTVIYRRYPGDVVGITLCRGGLATTADAMTLTGAFLSILGGGRPNMAKVLPPPRSIALTDRDLRPLLDYCKVVRKWEDIYPQLHWMTDPENCRTLEPVEKEKLRRALYRWWLHARHWHGDGPRPRRGLPEPFVDDPRTCSMRLHSTSDLMELAALMSAVKALVRHYIFPNLEQKLDDVSCLPLAPKRQKTDVLRQAPVSLMSQMMELRMQETVVDTYAKLDPKELMFYFENLYSYPRKRLVSDVNMRHPTFANDQESLHAAIRAATDERPWLQNLDVLEDIGQIVGLVTHCDDRLRRDGSPDATIPAPGVARRPQEDWSPPGDDGLALAERGMENS
jgi:hypothetical protein